MNEFIEKLIGRLEEYQGKIKLNFGNRGDFDFMEVDAVKEIANQLAEEYNNDACKWEYDEFEEKWQTDCEVLFALHDSDREITQYCPYCGKKIKIAPYQPKGEQCRSDRIYYFGLYAFIRLWILVLSVIKIYRLDC